MVIRPYERHYQDDRPYNCDPPRQDRRDRDRYRDDKPCRNDDRGYAKAAEPTKDHKGGHHAHHVETSAPSPRHRSRSCSTESSVREVKKICVRSPSHDRSRSRSTSGSEENYHLQSGDSPAKDEQDPSGWERKPAARTNVVPLAESHGNDGWDRKIPQRRLSHPPKSHQKILMLCWNHATPTPLSCHTTTDTGTTLHDGISRSHENHFK